jgi:hypothetical protein
VFNGGRKRLQIYLSHDNKQSVQVWKVEVTDLPEPRQGAVCSGVEGRGCGSI